MDSIVMDSLHWDSFEKPTDPFESLPRKFQVEIRAFSFVRHRCGAPLQSRFNPKVFIKFY